MPLFFRMVFRPKNSGSGFNEIISESGFVGFLFTLKRFGGESFGLFDD
jgi:hypothetical protein